MSISSVGSKLEELFFSSKQRVVSVLFIAIMVLSLPVTLLLLNQRQDIRQHAASQYTSAEDAIAHGVTDMGTLNQISATYIDPSFVAAHSPSMTGLTPNMPEYYAKLGISDNSMWYDEYGKLKSGATSGAVGGGARGTSGIDGGGVTGGAVGGACSGCQVFIGTSCIGGVCSPICNDSNSLCSSNDYCSGGTCVPYPTPTPVPPTPTSLPTATPTSTPVPPTPSPTPNQGSCQSYRSITLPNPNLPNNCPAGTYSSAVYICQDGSNPNTGISWCANSAEWATLVQGYCLPHSSCPVPTPIPTITLSPTPSCQLKAHGDANCDGKINTDDFTIWRDEFLKSALTNKSDFNADGKIDTDDFTIWRDGFLNATLPH